MKEQKYIVNPIVFFKWSARDDEHQTVDLLALNPENGVSFVVDEEMLLVFSNFREELTVEESFSLFYVEYSGSLDDYKLYLATLLDCNFLVFPEHTAKYEKWIKNNWFNALVFHLSTNVGNEYLDRTESKESSLAIKRNMAIEYFKESPLPHFYKVAGGEVLLPEVSTCDKTLWEVMESRRTYRNFTNRNITAQSLSNVLAKSFFPAKSIRDSVAKGIDEMPELLFNSHFVSFELSVLVLNSEEISPGLYNYDIFNNALKIVKIGDFSEQARTMAIGQAVDKCSAILVVTSIFERYMYRYRYSKALRNLFIEAGQLAHRLILTAVSENCKTFMTPATRDSYAVEFLELEEGEFPVYLIGIEGGSSRGGGTSKG